MKFGHVFYFLKLGGSLYRKCHEAQLPSVLIIQSVRLFSSYFANDAKLNVFCRQLQFLFFSANGILLSYMSFLLFREVMTNY